MLNPESIKDKKPRRRTAVRRRRVVKGGGVQSFDATVTITIKYAPSMDGAKVVLFDQNKEGEDIGHRLAHHVFENNSPFGYNRYNWNINNFTVVQNSDDRDSIEPKVIREELTEESAPNDFTPNNYYEIYYEGEEPNDTKGNVNNNGDMLSVYNSLRTPEEAGTPIIMFVKFTQNGIGTQMSNPIQQGECAIYNPGLLDGTDGVYLGVTNDDVHIGESPIDGLAFATVTDAALDTAFYALSFDGRTEITLNVSKNGEEYVFSE